VIFVGDTVQDVWSLINPATNVHISGEALNITATVYDEINNLHGTPVVAEIGTTGMYFIDFLTDAVGTWKVKWVFAGPPTYERSHMFIVRDAALVSLEGGYTIQGA